METPSPEPSAKTHHLRPRETVRKTVPFDMPIGTNNNKTPSSSLNLEEDLELSASTTAAHYIGHSGGRITAKRKNDALITIHNNPKRRRTIVNGNGVKSGSENGDNGTTEENGNEELQDVYCWECHKDCVEGALDCVSCPRTFHPLCTMSKDCSTTPSDNWICPVCLATTKAECSDTRSWAMQQLGVDQFCMILGFALQHMKHPDEKTSEAFLNPVPRSLLPDYYDIIFHPMDLSRLDRNIKRKTYASTEAFLEDAKWILHNSMIYNGVTHKLTADAKQIVDICRREMQEIEICPDCYLKSCVKKDDWFTEPCTLPHCLVWAKLRGFPFWPAKALRVSSNNHVDVRFFGAHDRAKIPMNQVYLLSAECPVPIKNTRKFGLDRAVNELNLHIKRLREHFGEFNYAPSRMEFKADDLYSCQVLFGNKVANSDLARLAVANCAERRYRESVSGCVDDQSMDGDNSKLSTPNAINRRSMDDGQSSDSESGGNASISGRSIDNAEALSKDDSSHMNGINSESSTGTHEQATKDNGVESNKSQNNAIKAPEQYPPVRLILSRNSKSGLVERAIKKNSSTQSVSQTPDYSNSDSSSNFEISTPLTSNAKSSQSAKKIFARTATVEVGIPNDSVTVRFNAGKRADPATVPKPPPAKDDDAVVRKRNLQSVLEKMQSNIQNLGSRSSVSPSTTKAAMYAEQISNQPSPATTATVGQTEPTRKVSVPEVISVASTSASVPGTSSNQTGADFEKYLDEVNSFMRATFSKLIQDAQSSTRPTTSSSETPKDNQSQMIMALRGEFNRMQCCYNETIRAMKQSARSRFIELQQALETEKNKALQELTRLHEEYLKQAIEETKSKQWCANCGKEAFFYCCWNTSYCDYPCRQQHWPKHQNTCVQIRQATSDSGTVTNSIGGPLVASGVHYTGNIRVVPNIGNVHQQAHPITTPLYTTRLPSQIGLLRAQGLSGQMNLAALIGKR